MKNMTLKEIACACGGVYYGDEEKYHQEVSGVAIDSRKVEKDYLFVAIRGARVDGHMFISQTIGDGALCAISEKRLEGVSFPYILVNSSQQALKDIAMHYRMALGVKVIGISGSVGKTSTKEMIASVLEQKYSVLKTQGNFNNEIGLPLTIFNIREEHEVAILEMGISDFGEMERLAKVARPDICILTNIGCAHLEQLKSREGILKAKTEMFLYMNSDGCIILNGDDDMLSTVPPFHHLTPQLFGLDSKMDYYAEEIENLGLKGTRALFHIPGGSFKATISIPGAHMVYNALAGAAAGHQLSLSPAEIKQGIEALCPLSGRNNLIETEHYTLIDDCYNANPDSMKASIDVLSQADTRSVAILGDMFELGPTELKMHHDIGKYAVESGIDVICCIGHLAREIAAGARGHEADVYFFETKAAFLEQSPSILREKDTILIKASHGMEFPEIVDTLCR